jgi:hypothetical protein
MRVVSRISGSAALVALVVFAVAPGIAAAQKVVRWVDSQGQVHYSDHAPPEARAEVVNDLPKTPPVPAPAPEPPRIQGEAPDFRQPYDPNEVIGSDKYGRKITRGQDDKEQAARASAHQQQQDKLAAERAKAQADAAQKKLQDDRQLMADCKTRRETFFDQGLEAVRRAEAERAWHQYDVEMGGTMSAQQDQWNHGRGRIGPPPKEPPMPRPEDPAKAKDKKK